MLSFVPGHFQMKTINRKKSFDQRWTSYALAGGAMLAAPLGSDAGVIVPTEPIELRSTTVPVSAFLDIDGDLTDDYEFVADGSDPENRFTYVNALNGNLIYGFFGPPPFNVHYATAFNVGETPSGPAIDGGGLFLADKFKSSAQAQKGDWPNDLSQLRLLGVRFTSSGQDYEGWVKVGVELGSASMDITEWAFE